MRMRRIVLASLALTAASLIPAAAASASAGGPTNGNSWAAHACQQGGYLSLVGSDGTTFSNVGACVSYAAHGGVFATGLVLPAGHTATISGAGWSACDALQYGYQVDFGANIAVDSKPGQCQFGVAAAGTTIGPFPTAVLLRIWLLDQSCTSGTPADWTYYSDGNHALVTGSNPFTVDIMDSFFCSSDTNTPRPPGGPGGGNVTMTVTFS